MPSFIFPPDYSKCALHEIWRNTSQGTVTAELVDYIQSNPSGSSLYFGTGVSMTRGISAGVPIEFLDFRQSAIEAARNLGLKEIVQDICDVLPYNAIELLAEKMGIDSDILKSKLYDASIKFKDFVDHLPPADSVSMRSVIVSQQRDTTNSDYNDILEEVRDAIRQAYRRLYGRTETMPTDDYLYEQIADMWRMRRDLGVLVKVGWYGPSRSEIRSGVLEDHHRSERYFDGHYSMAEDILDRNHGLTLPAMGFLYTLAGLNPRSDVTSPYHGDSHKILIRSFNGEAQPLAQQMAQLAEQYTAKQIASYARKITGIPDLEPQQDDRIITAIQQRVDSVRPSLV